MSLASLFVNNPKIQLDVSPKSQMDTNFSWPYCCLGELTSRIKKLSSNFARINEHFGCRPNLAQKLYRISHL